MTTSDKIQAVSLRACDPASFRRELKRSLDSQAVESGRDMHAMRREVAFEACLKRLAGSGMPFVLKGAYALEVRSPLRARTTKDVDILMLDGPAGGAWGDAAASDVHRRVAAALRTPSDDPFSFEVVEAKKEIGLGVTLGVRLFVAAKLMGQNFERFLMDAVVGDAFIDPAESADAGRRLARVGMATARVPLLTRAQHFAEKVHAYTLPREGLNTRVKDLVDMVVLGDLGVAGGEELARAVEVVFSHRATHRPPTSLPTPPAEWLVPYGRLAAGAGIGASMAGAHAVAAAIYDVAVS